MEEKAVEKKSSLATAGLVLGIVGMVMAFIPFVQVVSYPLGGLAAIFGAISIKKSKKGVAALVLGIVAIIIATSMLKGIGKAVDDAVDNADSAIENMNSAIENMNGKNTESLLENDVKVELGEFQITKGEFSDDYKLPVTVKNITDEKATFSIKIEAVDANGNRIKDDTIYANDLNADQSQEFEVFTLITKDDVEKLKNATFKILEVSKY